MSTLHENVWNILIKSFFLEKSCIGNQNTFVFNNFFPENGF